jgi:hypothetical protein
MSTVEKFFAILALVLLVTWMVAVMADGWEDDDAGNE